MKQIMKQYIKHVGDNDWKCVKCGCEFTLYLKGQYYLVPNYCPNCGSPYANGEPTPFTKFDDEE